MSLNYFSYHRDIELGSETLHHAESVAQWSER